MPSGNMTRMKGTGEIGEADIRATGCDVTWRYYKEMRNVVTRDARKEQAADVAQLYNNGNYVTAKGS